MSLRDRLRSRELPHAKVALRVDWSDESDENHRELEIARERLQTAVVSRLPEESLRQYHDEVTEAQAKVDQHYEVLIVRAIPAADMEQLIADHPPTKQDLERDETMNFNRMSFYPALLSMCVEGEETADDWMDMVKSGELSPGEFTTLISTAMEVNDRSPSVMLGKDSGTTLS